MSVKQWLVLKFNYQRDKMKLEDINQTTFAALDPEIQTQLIEASQTDPIIVTAFIIMMLMPMILMR